MNTDDLEYKTISAFQYLVHITGMLGNYVVCCTGVLIHPYISCTYLERSTINSTVEDQEISQNGQT